MPTPIRIYSMMVTPTEDTDWIYLLLDCDGVTIFRDVRLCEDLEFFYELQRQTREGHLEAIGWCYAADVEALIFKGLFKTSGKDELTDL